MRMNRRLSLDSQLLAAAVYDRASQLGISARQAARQMNLPMSTLTRLRKGDLISIPSLLCILEWLRIFDLLVFVSVQGETEPSPYVQMTIDELK